MTNATTPIEAAFEMQRQSIKQTQQLLEQSLTLQQKTLEPFLHKDISAQHSTNFEQGAKLLQQLVNAQFDAAESRPRTARTSPVTQRAPIRTSM